MCSCHSIPECYNMFSRVKLSIKSFCILNTLDSIIDNIHSAFSALLQFLILNHFHPRTVVLSVPVKYSASSKANVGKPLQYLVI